MRRLPIFLVIDVSESMVGSPLRHMQEGIKRLVDALRSDPYALETVYLSVIAFAGVAKTIAPLVELYSFYPPRLPVGSGTSLGAALNHLMDEMERHIIINSPEKKGDYKPVVYLMSDGSATDNPATAIARWQKHFAQRATLISIGIGSFADLSQLSAISQGMLRLENCHEQDFKEFIHWISQSVSSQSRSLGIDVPITINQDEKPMLSLVKNLQEATAIDENYVIINGLCAKTHLPYLMKYERLPAIDNLPQLNLNKPQIYYYTGVYAMEADYADWSDKRVNTQKVAASALMGAGGCPHCGASIGLAQCGCGQIFCANGAGVTVCPACQKHVYMDIAEGDFDISRSRG